MESKYKYLPLLVEEKNTMNTTKAVSVALVMLSVGALGAADAGAAPFKSKKGYSVQPPAGWTVNKSGAMGSDVIFATKARGGFAPNFNVVVQPLPRGATLAQIKQQSGELMKRSLSGFKMIGQSYTTVAGTRALST
jgi:hypothetical protein